MEKFTHESMHRAVESSTARSRLDPDFIAAYQAKSEALRSIFAYFEPPQELLPVVEASLAAVLERDPDSAEALSSLGLTQVMAWKWREAWAEPEKARALDPTLAQTEIGFALYYTALGENEKVKASLARAVEQDPLNSELADWGTWALFMVGEQQAARDVGRQADAPACRRTGSCSAGRASPAYLRGDPAEGVALLEHGVELSGRAPVALIMLAQGSAMPAIRTRCCRCSRRPSGRTSACAPAERPPGLSEASSDEASRAKSPSSCCTQADRQTFDIQNCLIFLRNDPRMRVLREDPHHAGRFEEPLTLVGLDEAAVRSYKK